jgi:ribose transport system permease protein
MVLVGISPLAQQGVQGGIILIAVALTGWPARRRLRVIK